MLILVTAPHGIPHTTIGSENVAEENVRVITLSPKISPADA